MTYTTISRKAFLRVGAGYVLVEGRSGRDLAGGHVYHCHILEHEDNGTMRPYDVVL